LIHFLNAILGRNLPAPIIWMEIINSVTPTTKLSSRKLTESTAKG